jgi:hypothetical protein
MRNLFLAAGLFLVIVLGLADAVFGQSVIEGSVPLELTLTAETGPTVYSFTICCGESQSAARGQALNVFSISKGTLNLSYKNAALPLSYTVTGSVNRWLTPQAISENCVVDSATFDNVSVYVYNSAIGTGKTFSGLIGTYSQMVCQDGGEYWDGGGGISIFAQ